MICSARGSVRVRHRVVRGTLVIDLGAVHRVLSSAPRRGGLARARSIVNHQVAVNPAVRRLVLQGRSRGRVEWSDPSRYLGKLAVTVGAKRPCVGLMTAVPMKQLVGVREESDEIWVECFCTVGVTNAVKAGEPASFAGSGRRCCQAGTINIILVTNAILSVPAMVGAVQVATESKTAVLMEQAVKSRTGRRLATGTGTDTVVVACRLRKGPRRHYSGTHTTIGSMIGRIVGQCVRAGLVRASRWKSRRATPVRV